MMASYLNSEREFFIPYCGSVVEPTEYNMFKAEANELNSVEWLNRRTEKAKSDLQLSGTEIHPITLTTQRLSLYDKFHEGNTTRRKEIVRRTGQIQELVGLNSETAEQINSYLKGWLSFLDCLSPVHHLLIVKSLFSIRSKERNKSLIGDHQENFDVYGRLTTKANESSEPNVAVQQTASRVEITATSPRQMPISFL